MEPARELPVLTDEEKARWQALRSDIREMAPRIRRAEATDEEIQAAFGRLAALDIDNYTLMNTADPPYIDCIPARAINSVSADSSCSLSPSARATRTANSNWRAAASYAAFAAARRPALIIARIVRAESTSGPAAHK